MKFKLHCVKEHRDATPDCPEVMIEEKDVEIDAESCCEAVMQAQHGMKDYIVTSWESLEKAGTAKKDIALNPAQFTSMGEYRRMQAKLSEMDEAMQKEFVEKHKYKVIA